MGGSFSAGGEHALLEGLRVPCNHHNGACPESKTPSFRVGSGRADSLCEILLTGLVTVLR